MMLQPMPNGQPVNAHVKRHTLSLPQLAVTAAPSTWGHSALSVHGIVHCPGALEDSPAGW
jgi:hypothetical protein